MFLQGPWDPPSYSLLIFHLLVLYICYGRNFESAKHRIDMICYDGHIIMHVPYGLTESP